MKKIKYIGGIWFLFILFGMVNCKQDDELLKEIPETFYTVDNAFSSSGQVDQVLITIYSQLRDLWTCTNQSASQYLYKGHGTDMLDNYTPASSPNNYAITSSQSSIFYDNYSYWYNMINRANLVIYTANLPQISWSSPAEKAYVAAQARFFRAFAYRNLAELFGGVPIVTEYETVPRFDYTRATRVETYQFAITEMEAIENDLPETTTIAGRLVKGAAQHNLCELYLAMGTQLSAEGKSGEALTAFNKSINYGNKVIDGGTYSLINQRFGTRKNETTISIKVYKGGVPTATVDTILQTTNYYWDLFQEGNVDYQSGNKECIWAAQIDYAAYKAEDKKSFLGYTRTFGNAIRGNSQLMFQGTLEDLGGRGVRSVIPNMYLRDEIYLDKWGQDMRNSEVVFRRRFKGNNPASSYYLKIVPWNIIYYGTTSQSTNDNNRATSYPMSCKITTDRFTGLADGQNMSNLFRDDYYIRLSETILLRAEAKQRSGDKSGAAADVNLLRTRAQCSYMVTSADMDDNFNLILDERARELVYEECRWNTLLRMGGTIGFDRIKKYTYWDQNRATMTRSYNLWPIPQTVIDSNTGAKMEQNPGWQ
jgi:starch-binding outer membrane protein, SusD/RagB family